MFKRSELENQVLLNMMQSLRGMILEIVLVYSFK